MASTRGATARRDFMKRIEKADQLGQIIEVDLAYVRERETGPASVTTHDGTCEVCGGLSDSTWCGPCEADERRLREQGSL